MCGRHFRHGLSWEEFHAQLSLFRPDEIPIIEPAYNVSPTQVAPIIRLWETDQEPELVFARWDFVPRWWRKRLSEKSSLPSMQREKNSRQKPLSELRLRIVRVLYLLVGIMNGWELELVNNLTPSRWEIDGGSMLLDCGIEFGWKIQRLIALPSSQRRLPA